MNLSILTILSTLLTLILAIVQIQTPHLPKKNGKTCKVLAHGNKTDDTPQIFKAFSDCNNGGTVIFPSSQNYWIASKLNPVICDVEIQWRGVWTVCYEIPYIKRERNADVKNSSRITSTIGVTTRTPLHSKTTPRISSFPARGYILTDMEREV